MWELLTEYGASNAAFLRGRSIAVGFGSCGLNGGQGGLIKNARSLHFLPLRALHCVTRPKRQWRFVEPGVSHPIPFTMNKPPLGGACSRRCM